MQGGGYPMAFTPSRPTGASGLPQPQPGSGNPKYYRTGTPHPRSHPGQDTPYPQFASQQPHHQQQQQQRRVYPATPYYTDTSHGQLPPFNDPGEVSPFPVPGKRGKLPPPQQHAQHAQPGFTPGPPNAEPPLGFNGAGVGSFTPYGAGAPGLAGATPHHENRKLAPAPGPVPSVGGGQHTQTPMEADLQRALYNGKRKKRPRTSKDREGRPIASEHGHDRMRASQSGHGHGHGHGGGHGRGSSSEMENGHFEYPHGPGGGGAGAGMAGAGAGMRRPQQQQQQQQSLAVPGQLKSAMKRSNSMDAGAQRGGQYYDYDYGSGGEGHGGAPLTRRRTSSLSRGKSRLGLSPGYGLGSPGMPEHSYHVFVSFPSSSLVIENLPDPGIAELKQRVVPLWSGGTYHSSSDSATLAPDWYTAKYGPGPYTEKTRLKMQDEWEKMERLRKERERKEKKERRVWKVRFMGDPWGCRGKESVSAMKVISGLFELFAMRGYTYQTMILNSSSTPRLAFTASPPVDPPPTFFIGHFSQSGHRLTLCDPPSDVRNGLEEILSSLVNQEVLENYNYGRNSSMGYGRVGRQIEVLPRWSAELRSFVIEISKTGFGAPMIDKPQFIAHSLKALHVLGYALHATIPLGKRFSLWNALGVAASSGGGGWKRELLVFRQGAERGLSPAPQMGLAPMGMTMGGGLPPSGSAGAYAHYGFSIPKPAYGEDVGDYGGHSDYYYTPNRVR